MWLFYADSKNKRPLFCQFVPPLSADKEIKKKPFVSILQLRQVTEWLILSPGVQELKIKKSRIQTLLHNTNRQLSVRNSSLGLKIPKLMQSPGYFIKNRPFYSCGLSTLAFEWMWGWRWPCLNWYKPRLLYYGTCSSKILARMNRLQRKSVLQPAIQASCS